MSIDFRAYMTAYCLMQLQRSAATAAYPCWRGHFFCSRVQRAINFPFAAANSPFVAVNSPFAANSPFVAVNSPFVAVNSPFVAGNNRDMRLRQTQISQYPLCVHVGSVYPCSGPVPLRTCETTADATCSRAKIYLTSPIDFE